jgi:flagellar assembly factor FliW
MTATLTQLIFHSPKLGDVSYSTEDVIRFSHGLPGFEALREFLLVTREECEPFVFLASLERPAVALPLIPLALASAGLQAQVEAVAPVSRDAEGTVVSYAVVSIGVEASEVIVNLRAPVVVNLDTRLGCQVIMPDDSLSVSARLEA